MEVKWSEGGVVELKRGKRLARNVPNLRHSVEYAFDRDTPVEAHEMRSISESAVCVCAGACYFVFNNENVTGSFLVYRWLFDIFLRLCCWYFEKILRTLFTLCHGHNTNFLFFELLITSSPISSNTATIK